MRPISQAAIRFFLLVGILAAAVPAAHASAARDCVDQTGTQEIAACTEFLLAKNLTKSARAMGYYYRAHGYLSTGNYEAALKDLREVIRRIGAKTEIGRAAQLLIDINNPDTADGNYAIAIGIREPQDGHDTAFFLERALSIEPDHAQSLYLRGYNRFKEGDFEGAVQDLEIAVPGLQKKDPDAARFASEILTDARGELFQQKKAPTAEQMDQRAAEAAALDDRKLCATALDGKRTDFEVDPNFRVYVEEAKKRSLNVQKCITLVASPPVDTTGLLEKAKLLVGDLEAYAKSSPSTPLSPVVVRAAVAVNAIIQTSDRADLQSALGELEAALGGNADALAYLAETQRKRDETKKADASRTNDEARLLASFLEGFAAANLTDARTVRVLTAADALARAKDKADDGAVSSATTLLSELNLQEAYTEFKAQRCSAEKTPAC